MLQLQRRSEFATLGFCVPVELKSAKDQLKPLEVEVLKIEEYVNDINRELKCTRILRPPIQPPPFLSDHSHTIIILANITAIVLVRVANGT